MVASTAATGLAAVISRKVSTSGVVVSTAMTGVVSSHEQQQPPQPAQRNTFGGRGGGGGGGGGGNCGTSSSSSSSSSLIKILSVAIGFQMIFMPLVFFHFSHSSSTTTTTPALSTILESSSSSSSGSRIGAAGGTVVVTAGESPVGIKGTQQQQRPITSIRTTQTASSSMRTADGSFNGYPIYLKSGKNAPIHSSVECVGQNYQENAWIHRSCKFRHFCFDTNTSEFVVYQSFQDKELEDALLQSKFSDASNQMGQQSHVALGGINTKWTWSKGIPRMKWFPKVIVGELKEDYYELDEKVVWVPYHSFFAQNPGHLVWDDFLPIYTLLRIFHLFQDDGFQPLLMRYILKGKGMWATCDMNDEKKEVCHEMYTKFLPLFGLQIGNFSTTEDFRFLIHDDQKPKSTLVCAAQGAAGLGMLTDHGYKLHGWDKKDYLSMHNHGRGAMLYEFRNFMVENMGLEVKKLRQGGPYVITFATSTSRSTLRSFSFRLQIRALKEAFGAKVIVQQINFPEMSTHDQVKVASETAIYVSACGGGAVTAMFLPHGAATILFFVEDGGVQNNRLSGLPARLDWDLFNNMAWTRSHWMPAGSMNNATDIDIFVKLVAQEIDLMDHQIL